MNCSIPDFLKEMLEKQYGKEITKRIIQGYEIKRYTTFRVNTLKRQEAEVEEILKKKDRI